MKLMVWIFKTKQFIWILNQAKEMYKFALKAFIVEL